MSDNPADPFHEGREAAKARKLRSFGIALLLIAFVALVFAVTIMKMSGRG